jgi:hypothetical protein
VTIARFLGLRDSSGLAEVFTVDRDFDRFAFFPLFLLLALLPAVFFLAAALVFEAVFFLAVVLVLEVAFFFTFDFVFVFFFAVDLDLVFDFEAALDFDLDLDLATVLVFVFALTLLRAVVLALTFPRVDDLTFVLLTEPRFALTLLVDLRLAVDVVAARLGFCFGFGVDLAAVPGVTVLTAFARVPPAMVARAAANRATGTLNGLHET